MSRLICFIDLDGGVGTCTKKAEGDCKNCGFYEKFKGKEEAEFYYCAWLGQVKDVRKNHKYFTGGRLWTGEPDD